MKFVRRLSTLVSLWLLHVWRSSFSHGKNPREYVVGGRKNLTFDTLDLLMPSFMFVISDHFCENFCKILQHIKRKYSESFFHVNQQKKFILRKSCISIKILVSFTTDTVPIWLISFSECFSSKWVSSDLMASSLLQCKKNWILTL